MPNVGNSPRPKIRRVGEVAVREEVDMLRSKGKYIDIFVRPKTGDGDLAKAVSEAARRDDVGTRSVQGCQPDRALVLLYFLK